MQTFWKELNPCSDGSVSKKENGGEGRKRVEEQGGQGGGETEDWNVMGDVIPGCCDALR